jgi:catechol 2,3-dioxygenase-like lactoylglutathione lyase family enzyme
MRYYWRQMADFTSMLKDIDHVLLAMPRGEEDAARAFYGNLLGLNEIEKPLNLRARGGVWFELGTKQLHLGVESNFTPAKKAHPAFRVDDLDFLKEKLVTAGFPITYDEPLYGYDRFFSHDPFGNRLEFLRPLR